MWHKVKKANEAVKVGDFIYVHEDQTKDLVDRGLIEKDGIDELPVVDADKKATKEAKVSGTSSIETKP